MDSNSSAIGLDFLKVWKLKWERKETESQEMHTIISCGFRKAKPQFLQETAEGGTWLPEQAQPLPHHRATTAVKGPCAHFTTRESKQRLNTAQNEMINHCPLVA